MQEPRAEPSGRRRMAVGLMALVVVAALLALLLAKVDAVSLYPWAKALHVVAVISWMAGVLYLPRLFVYHCTAPKGSEQSETFKIMERRLYRGIIVPAMAASWVVGLYLAGEGFGFMGGWLHAKILCVLLLSGFTGYLGGAVRRFAGDANSRTQRHWRLMNEVPTLLMVAIVILVVVKPF